MVTAARYRMYRRSGHGVVASAILAPPMFCLLLASVVIGALAAVVL